MENKELKTPQDSIKVINFLLSDIQEINKKYPNDQEFGAKVRKTLSRFNSLKFLKSS